MSRFRVGEATFDCELERGDSKLVLNAEQHNGDEYRIIFSPPFGPATEVHEVTIDGQRADDSLIPIEGDVHCRVEFQLNGQAALAISFTQGIELNPPEHVPQIGYRSSGLKILNTSLQDDDSITTAEG